MRQQRFPIIHFLRLVLLMPLAFFFAACGKPDNNVLRIGFFPNITHAQAVIAQQMAFEEKDWHGSRLPAGTTLQWFQFNAGPTAMEQLLIGSIDVSYVGPNPALNAYVRRGGSEIYQLAGSATGGSALVAQPSLAVSTPPKAADFSGKTIGTPQFGNTQDVACRSWLIKGGLKVHATGGDTRVLPMQNPELVQAFRQKNLDAAWTVEPWVSRLVRDEGGKIVPVAREFPDITTILVSGEDALVRRAELVRAFVKSHRELTAWINANPDEAAGYLHRGLIRLTKTPNLSGELITAAFKNITFTAAVDRASMQAFVDDAYAIKMLEAPTKPELGNFFKNAEK